MSYILRGHLLRLKYNSLICFSTQLLRLHKLEFHLVYFSSVYSTLGVLLLAMCIHSTKYRVKSTARSHGVLFPLLMLCELQQTALTDFILCSHISPAQRDISLLVWSFVDGATHASTFLLPLTRDTVFLLAGGGGAIPLDGL